MDNKLILKLNKSFEEAAYKQNGVEYWLARDLQILLEYEEWRNFLKLSKRLLYFVKMQVKIQPIILLTSTK